MKLIRKAIKDWMNQETEIGVLIRRKIIVIGIITLMLYGSGYAIGTFIAHLGF